MKKIKVLVLVEGYPSPFSDQKAMTFVHARNLEYAKNDIEVQVLNFATNNDYTIDGIKVYSMSSIKKQPTPDLYISHCPNIRHHMVFLIKNRIPSNKIFFIFHGQDIRPVEYDDPVPYSWNQKKLKRRIAEKLYSVIKLPILHYLFKYVYRESQLIFVSKSLKNEFFKHLKLQPTEVSPQIAIIHNPVAKIFCDEHYDKTSEKIYDFITIRSTLNNSTYCADILLATTRSNPQYKFCIIGKTNFFNHNIITNNITHINKNLSHMEIINYLNQSKCALMLSRIDSQGVMACEMATFGIPLIVSNTEVAKEIFSQYPNIYFLNDNEHTLDDAISKLQKQNSEQPFMNYVPQKTVMKEIDLIKNFPYK